MRLAEKLDWKRLKWYIEGRRNRRDVGEGEKLNTKFLGENQIGTTVMGHLVDKYF
jgi:hypothetical protein